jgi:hypothetical protein
MDCQVFVTNSTSSLAIPQKSQPLIDYIRLSTRIYRQLTMNTAKWGLLGGFLLCTINSSLAQRGKEGSVVAPGGTAIVNTYTYLTANATAGTNTLTVFNNSMTGGAFGAVPLAPGDLVMIIQMQGVSMDINTTPTVGWGGEYTVPNEYIIPDFTLFGVNPHKWGAISNYNNSGLHERREVLSVSGGNTITLNCDLSYNYTSTGHVQVIRIPRYDDFTVGVGSTIAPTLWDGNSGGVVALEVDGTFTLNGAVNADFSGFRGGALDPDSFTAGGPPSEVRFLGSNNFLQGSRKGEGIGGYETEYFNLESEYGIGAAANGGGGGGYQNTGGGGGCNVLTATWTYNGKGNPKGYSAIWDLETPLFGGSVSSGGGRGGYAFSSANQDETAMGPRDAQWGGDDRKANGGFGGHPLLFVADRIWFGGGGGAGDQDSDEGGAGGRGGGMVFMDLYGPNAGTGTISALGEAGQNSDPTGAGVSSLNQKSGEDGAGGGGAGGTIHIVNVSALPAALLLDVTGGDGGDQDIDSLVSSPPIVSTPAFEAGGPGGSGSGGYIRITSGAPTKVLTSGTAGVTNSASMVNFPPNGATEGKDGFPLLPANPAFNLTLTDVTICTGTSISLVATQFGAAAGTVTWYDAMVGGSVVTTGLSYTTPVLASTTTYWVGVCPGSFRERVTVTVDACLPTELTDFWHLCDPYPVLHWETASEHDNDYFTVERSCDLIDYEELATLDGQESSLSLTEYIYHDTEREDCILDEVVYYRLSQTDFNGTHKILGTISSNCEREISEPSIATTISSIVIQYSEEFQVNIYTTDGKLIHQTNSINGNAIVPKSDFTTGIYLIQIIADRQFNSRVLISNQ